MPLQQQANNQLGEVLIQIRTTLSKVRVNSLRLFPVIPMHLLIGIEPKMRRNPRFQNLLSRWVLTIQSRIIRQNTLLPSLSCDISFKTFCLILPAYCITFFKIVFEDLGMSSQRFVLNTIRKS